MSFKVINDTYITCQNGEELHLQYGQLNGGNYFYRFHRKKVTGFLTRGQAVINSLADIHKLISQAIEEGWKIS